MTKIVTVLFVFSSCLFSLFRETQSKFNEGIDLLPSSPLRVGVKRRVKCEDVYVNSSISILYIIHSLISDQIFLIISKRKDEERRFTFSSLRRETLQGWKGIRFFQRPVSVLRKIRIELNVPLDAIISLIRVSAHFSVLFFPFLPSNTTTNCKKISRELPLEFMLGAGKVIRGWDLGLVKMCLGEIRKITIPSDLAYGDVGSPHDIYPGATLVYEIELLDISHWYL